MNPKLNKLIATSPSFGPLFARLTLAAVMFPHGAQKVLGWFGGYGLTGTLKFFAESLHIPAPLALLAFAAEFLGPLLLLLGAFSRIAALAVAVTMAVAIKFHLPNGFFMNWSANQAGEGFEYHLLVIGLALVVLVQGGGGYSVDGSCAVPSGPRPRD
jgi:putative oxidoreductase